MTNNLDRLGMLFPPHTSLQPYMSEAAILQFHWWLVPFCITWGLIIWAFYTPVDDDVKLKRKVFLSTTISCVIWILFIVFVR